MTADDARRTTLARVLGWLDAAVDAAADAVTAESVYQLARGNLTRAATLDDIAGGLAPPPRLEMMRTPRTGTPVTHRVAIVLDAAARVDPASGWNASSPRATVEPRLDAWAAAMLGPAVGVEVVVAELDARGDEVGRHRVRTGRSRPVGARPGVDQWRRRRHHRTGPAGVRGVCGRTHRRRADRAAPRARSADRPHRARCRRPARGGRRPASPGRRRPPPRRCRPPAGPRRPRSSRRPRRARIADRRRPAGTRCGSRRPRRPARRSGPRGGSRAPRAHGRRRLRDRRRAGADRRRRRRSGAAGVGRIRVRERGLRRRHPTAGRRRARTTGAGRRARSGPSRSSGTPGARRVRPRLRGRRRVPRRHRRRSRRRPPLTGAAGGRPPGPVHVDDAARAGAARRWSG